MIYKKQILILILFTLVFSAMGQIAPDKYWIQFTDKNGTPYSVDNPEQFLSQRAIDRRFRYNIPVSENDLPLTPQYIDSIESLGFKILHCSKWFNTVTVYSIDSTLIDSVGQFSFVANTCKVSKMKNPDATESVSGIENTQGPPRTEKKASTLFDYGLSANQIEMLNGHILHNNGLQGQGLIIAITDAGFFRADTFAAFDSLWYNNQILGIKDFVCDTEDLFSIHSHGMSVLSIIGGNIPGQLIGSAPKAEFWLLRTEDAGSEYTIEEDNWIAAAEFADSAGADIINISLGYSTFDNPSQDYSYADLDGNTSRMTQGVDIASSKGLLVVVSAGNSGDAPWHYIGIPADADSALTVGAVDDNRVYADFSSTGPTADGRVKPDVVAVGKGTVHESAGGYVTTGNGTSFSAPIITGMAACLWQANRNLSNIEIINYIKRSAHMYHVPDSLLGYGIPDFAYAYFMIQGIEYNTFDQENYLRTYPNPFSNELCIEFYSVDSQNVTIELYDIAGHLILKKKISVKLTSFNKIILDELGSLGQGTYIIRLTSKKETYQDQIIRM